MRPESQASNAAQPPGGAAPTMMPGWRSRSQGACDRRAKKAVRMTVCHELTLYDSTFTGPDRSSPEDHQRSGADVQRTSTDAMRRRQAGEAPLEVLLGVVVAFALVAAACGSSKGRGSTRPHRRRRGRRRRGTPVDGGSVVIGIAAETNGWNPAWPSGPTRQPRGLERARAAGPGRRGLRRQAVPGRLLDRQRQLHRLDRQAASRDQVPRRRAVRRGGGEEEHRLLQDRPPLGHRPLADDRRRHGRRR